MTTQGALRFARFAVPPNARGYCGPHHHDELAAYRTEELAVDAGLRELAAGFEGAWPYLELLADAASTDDPLDDRVVEAYWIGNELCGRVATLRWGNHLMGRFGPRVGRDVERLTASVGSGAVPHHAFHVFCVYPWVGLLREGRGGAEPMRILRNCYVSWGTVVDRVGDDVVIDGPPLGWQGAELTLDGTQRRSVWLDPRLTRVAMAVRPGAVVAVHWGEVVDVLTVPQRLWLERITRRQVELANRVGVPVL